MRLGIAHGALAELGKTLADPNVVLTLLLRQIGGSHTLVGLLSSIRYGGWFLPQLIVANRVEGKPRKAPYYLRAEMTRSAGYVLIALAIVYISKPDLLLLTFLTLFSASYLAHGVGSVPKFDVIGRAIPAEERGGFFAQRNLWAGLVGLAAGLVVRYALSAGEAGGPPLNRYALLVALSALCFALAAATFSRIPEPTTGSNSDRPISWLKQLRRVSNVLLQNHPFRAMATSLVLTDIAQRMADPFFMIFATEMLRIPAPAAGFYLSALVISKIAANLLWERLGRRYPNRLTLQCSAAAAVAAPALAILIGVWTSFRAPAPAGWTSFTASAFGLIYLLMGIRDSGRQVGKRSVLLDIVPAEQRPTYWGLLNTLLGLAGLLPVVAGKIVDDVGFQPVFGAAVATAVGGWLASRRLETRQNA